MYKKTHRERFTHRMKKTTGAVVNVKGYLQLSWRNTVSRTPDIWQMAYHNMYCGAL